MISMRYWRENGFKDLMRDEDNNGIVYDFPENLNELATWNVTEIRLRIVMIDKLKNNVMN